MPTELSFIVGIDIGGTFTDITVIAESGDIIIDKVPTTPWDFSQGVIEAVDKIAEAMGLDRDEFLSRCLMVKHGSTVATNAVITGDGSKVGLITTSGFEDTTLIMRGIGRVAGLSEDEIKHQASAVKPVPIVPKELIRGVLERVNYKGEIAVPIDLDDAARAVKELVEDCAVEALAVNFLWSFMNPSHEFELKKLIQRLYGDRDLYLSLASELCPVIREYARGNTVILNAFLGKTVERYISSLERKLQSGGYGHPLLIMQANGGVVHAGETTPIGNIGSGPSGGVIASKYIADLLGHKEVITTDMGGTSFDVSLLVDGFWRYSREPIVGRFHITWPMLDIESIGAGGGTIAWVDPVTKGMRLGPKSAGAVPGPVCYDKGGAEPTVTDANLVLGLLDPDYFLGGRMRLDKEKAERAIEGKVAKPLGMDTIEAAAGIHTIINSHMSDLIRKKVVTTGHVPEEFVIYSFGGAAPLHAAAYGSELSVKKLYVFPTSAVFSSFGVATADLAHTYAISYRYRMPVEAKVLNDRMSEIEGRLLAVMESEGIKKQNVSFRRTFFMRYRRQLNEIDVKVPVKIYDHDDINSIMEQFERRYEDVYGEGSAYSAAGVELISITVDAIGATIKPGVKSHPRSGETLPPKDALKGYREAVFPGELRFIRAKVYDYTKLEPSNMVEGPAIAETPVTTVVIPAGWVAKVDDYLNIELSRKTH